MALTTRVNTENSFDIDDFTEEADSGDKKQITFVGPYISHFSFAKINRGLANAMSKAAQAKDYAVKIWRDSGEWLDKLPTQENLQEMPEVRPLLTDDVEDTEITIFDSSPANPNDPFGLDRLPGKVRTMYIAWEESVYPADKIIELNNNMHGLMPISQFTLDVLRRNGIKIPMQVVSCALNDTFLEHKPVEYKLDTNKKFKFLHISTAKVRKGVDVLIKSYFEAFTEDDDVCLVIKSFPGPDNVVNTVLGELKDKYDNPPEVLHIFDPNLTEAELINLQDTCQVSVYPTRAEGFGLPPLEAMYLSKPVIITSYSGQMDFCNSDNCYLLDFEIADAVDSEFANVGAKWAEPDGEQLSEYMRFLYENYDSAEVDQVRKAAHRDASKFIWKNSAQQAYGFLEKIEQIAHLKAKSMAVISPINTVSGIAEYTTHLYESIEKSFTTFTYFANSDAADLTRPDATNVIRCWEQGSNDMSDLATKLNETQPDYIHIQYHSAEITPAALINLLDGIDYTPAKILITIHDGGSAAALPQNLVSQFKQTKTLKLIAHDEDTAENLSKAGIENISIQPHPYHTFPQWDQQKLRAALKLQELGPIIATHGIASHHKGLLQTADAVAELKQDYPNILWLALNAVSINNISSSNSFEELESKIQELGIADNVRLFPEFMEAPLEIVALLQASDIGILAYDDVGESASGAIRKLLGSGLPTIVTDTPIMEDLDQEVVKIADNEPGTIATTVKELFENINRRKTLREKALQLSKQKSWENSALELLMSL